MRKFFEERLPKRFAIGSGEIVIPERVTSSQEDVIIYDALASIPLIFSDSVQVFPIESVYGVVEVKSTLSKVELLDSLKKIKSVKELAPNDIVQLHHGAMSSGIRRPAPFGMVFAYVLADNSLSSLAANLAEWEAENEPSLWPNCIVVLGKGIIVHIDSLGRNCIHSSTISRNSTPISLEYLDDSLFQFYATLLDVISEMQLGPTRLRQYYDMPERVGRWVVKNHDRLIRYDENKRPTKNVYRIKSEFLTEVIEWAQSQDKMTGADAQRYMHGCLPNGTTDRDWPSNTFVYNPDNLAHGLEATREELAARQEDRTPPPSALNYLTLVVDNIPLVLPCAYLTDDRVELIPDMDTSDL